MDLARMSGGRFRCNINRQVCHLFGSSLRCPGARVFSLRGPAGGGYCYRVAVGAKKMTQIRDFLASRHFTFCSNSVELRGF